MTLYRILLFVHVVAAIMLLGPLFAHPLVRSFRGHPVQPAVLKIEEAIGRVHGIGLVVMLLSGGWLIAESPFTEDFGEATWLHISLLLYLVWAGLTGGLWSTTQRKARELVEAGRPDEAAPLLNRIDTVIIPVIAAVVVLLVFLMTYKPFV